MRRLILALSTSCAAAAACSRPAGTPPPPAEFLLTSQDSAFWVATTEGEVHVHGVPITLARYGGRFYELYTTDDDFSYDNALLLGERLYRRDIVTGDSAAVFTDTAVVRIAADYARNHPDERPLGPDEEGEANPETQATSQVDVTGVFGPYVSYEYHVDVDLPGRLPWHSTRYGVLDLRTGAEARVSDLFGPAAGQAAEAGGRKRFASIQDSVRDERDALSRGADVLLRLKFDEQSFSLSSDEQKPAITFAIPGRGPGRLGDVIELDPVAVDATDWWRRISSEFPITNDAGNDTWDRSAYRVLARYDTSGELARISLADTSRREWPVATVLGPLRRIEWLDQPRLTDADRQALRKAFNSAASYDETSRVAAHRSSTLTYAHFQDRPRKPARNVGAHDARAREQHGTRVRRGHSVDDGQDGGHLRVSPLPRGGGHGVDRPRGLSRAHPPRRSRGHEVERQLRRTHVDGSGRSR